MIPYIHVPDPGFIHPFGILVATGVLIGIWLATKRARSLDYDLDRLNSFITWMLVCGFIGGHMLDEIFYHPKEVLDEPLSLLMLWRSLSSFGGFAGAFIGIGLWKYYYFESKFPGHAWLGWMGRIRRREVVQPILPFADLILSVFPVAWVFGRMGCSSVHDHPGALAVKGAFLAVEFPRGFPPDASPEYVAKTFTGPRGHFGPIEFLHGELPRYDLGLLEMLFTLVLASALALTWHKKVRVGTYVVATALTYAPVRFAMDYLRITEGINADPRYGGLTPAQWCCIALFAFGLGMITLMMRHKSRAFDPGQLVVVGSASGERAATEAAVAAKGETSDDAEQDEDDDEEDEEAEAEPKAKEAKPVPKEAKAAAAPAPAPVPAKEGTEMPRLSGEPDKDSGTKDA